MEKKIQFYVNYTFIDASDKLSHYPREAISGFLEYEETDAEKQEEYISHLKKIRSFLNAMNDELERESNKPDSIEKLELIFSRFHLVANRLKNRYNNRQTLIISDEHDVHDLLHAILMLFFEDIRPEEPTLSVGGGHRKMDFSLKPKATVIETKITSENLSTRQLNEQLNDDIITYREHLDCDILVIFVYDPDNRINNRSGFKKDIVKNSSYDLNVLAYISLNHRF